LEDTPSRGDNFGALGVFVKKDAFGTKSGVWADWCACGSPNQNILGFKDGGKIVNLPS
jgi:hypothetical protein